MAGEGVSGSVGVCRGSVGEGSVHVSRGEGREVVGERRRVSWGMSRRGRVEGNFAEWRVGPLCREWWARVGRGAYRREAGEVIRVLVVVL